MGNNFVKETNNTETAFILVSVHADYIRGKMLFFFVYLQKDNYIKHNEILNQRKSIISFWKDVMKLYLMYYRDSILTNKKILGQLQSYCIIWN